MRLDWRTPGYMGEETDRWMMRGRAGRRTWSYEEKLKEGKGGMLARKCWEEMRDRWKKGKVIGRWEQEKKEFYRERRVEEGEEERIGYEELERRDRQKQRIERKERIEASKYNKWYNVIKKERVPQYLKKDWAEKRWKRIIRYRLGNEVRGGLYWEDVEKKKCRLCEREEETWEHIWERCVRGEKWGDMTWQEAVLSVLGEEGEGEEWLKELDEARSFMGGEEGGER